MENASKFFSNCNHFNESDVHKLALIRGSVSIVCFLLCLATFILELVYTCRNKNSTTLQRLFVYLTVSNMLYTGVLSMHIHYYIEYYIRYNDEHFRCNFCIIVGFLDEYTGLVQLCFTLGVVIKLFHKLITTTVCPHQVKGFSYHHHRKLEVSFVILSFVLPLLIAWIPFIMKNGHYGPYGPWCWINRMEKDCNGSLSGLLEELLIWYIPFAAVAFLSLICIITIIIFLFWIHARRNYIREKIRVVIADFLLLLPFLIIFSFVCIIEVSVVIIRSRLLSTFAAWVIYAICTPIGVVAIPIAFLIYFCRKRKYVQKNDVANITNARTICPSSRLSPNSFTDQQDRPNLLSRSDEWTYASTGTTGTCTSGGSLLFGTSRRYGALDT